MDYDIVKGIDGFDWDKGNSEKNWLKHNVNKNECEEIFADEFLITIDDSKHSKSEKRFYAFGITTLGRPIAIAFTIRDSRIRVIMARDMSKKEREFYYEQRKKSYS